MCFHSNGFAVWEKGGEFSTQVLKSPENRGVLYEPEVTIVDKGSVEPEQR